ncbi:hypothetical protein EDC04DRAFT_483690 [Pisolithus marmoratus]|nr:hypothetical protein EDC04DRAFT_483690 [Pisolithus marmoratus]
MLFHLLEVCYLCTPSSAISGATAVGLQVICAYCCKRKKWNGFTKVFLNRSYISFGFSDRIRRGPYYGVRSGCVFILSDKLPFDHGTTLKANPVRDFDQGAMHPHHTRRYHPVQLCVQWKVGQSLFSTAKFRDFFGGMADVQKEDTGHYGSASRGRSVMRHRPSQTIRSRIRGLEPKTYRLNCTDHTLVGFFFHSLWHRHP